MLQFPLFKAAQSEVVAELKEQSKNHHPIVFSNEELQSLNAGLARFRAISGNDEYIKYLIAGLFENAMVSGNGFPREGEPMVPLSAMIAVLRDTLKLKGSFHLQRLLLDLQRVDRKEADEVEQLERKPSKEEMEERARTLEQNKMDLCVRVVNSVHDNMITNVFLAKREYLLTLIHLLCDALCAKKCNGPLPLDEQSRRVLLDQTRISPSRSCEYTRLNQWIRENVFDKDLQFLNQIEAEYVPIQRKLQIRSHPLVWIWEGSRHARLGPAFEKSGEKSGVVWLDLLPVLRFNKETETETKTETKTKTETETKKQWAVGIYKTGEICFGSVAYQGVSASGGTPWVKLKRHDENRTTGLLKRFKVYASEKEASDVFEKAKEEEAAKAKEEEAAKADAAAKKQAFEEARRQAEMMVLHSDGSVNLLALSREWKDGEYAGIPEEVFEAMLSAAALGLTRSEGGFNNDDLQSLFAFLGMTVPRKDVRKEFRKTLLPKLGVRHFLEIISSQIERLNAYHD